MPDGTLLDELVRTEEESFEKILLSLLDIENISMKTEIQRPLNLTKLDIFALALSQEKLSDSAEIIQKFIAKYLEYMVSHKRQSRKEIIQALTEGLKEQRTLSEKLMSKPASG